MFGAPPPNIAKGAIAAADNIAKSAATLKPLRSAAKGVGNAALWGVKKFAGRQLPQTLPPAPVPGTAPNPTPTPQTPANYTNAADQNPQETFGQNDAAGVVRDNDDSTLIRNMGKSRTGGASTPEKPKDYDDEDFLKE
jgi:hypothetical protein